MQPRLFIFITLIDVLLAACSAPAQPTALPTDTLIPVPSPSPEPTFTLTPLATDTAIPIPTEITQVEYWKNPDGTIKPGEIIPAGCLAGLDGKDTCVFNPDASHKYYSDILRALYTVAASSGKNVGGFWDGTDNGLSHAADKFVEACMAGQSFSGLQNMSLWEGSVRSGANTDPRSTIVKLFTFEGQLSCSNIQIEVLTREQMETRMPQGPASGGWWSWDGGSFYGRFEQVPLEGESGVSILKFVFGSVEQLTGVERWFALTNGETSEALVQNLGLTIFSTMMDPSNGPLKLRRADSQVPFRSAVLWDRSAFMNQELHKARSEVKLQEYLNTNYGGGLLK